MVSHCGLRKQATMEGTGMADDTKLLDAPEDSQKQEITRKTINPNLIKLYSENNEELGICRRKWHWLEIRMNKYEFEQRVAASDNYHFSKKELADTEEFRKKADTNFEKLTKKEKANMTTSYAKKNHS
jgi:hypothetical protein